MTTIDRDAVLEVLNERLEYLREGRRRGYAVGMAELRISEVEALIPRIAALPTNNDEVERLREADARQIRMAVAAWLEGRRDAEFWLKHIHVTLGSPTSAQLKRDATNNQERRTG